MRQIAGPHRRRRRATAQGDAHGDLGLFHHALALLFAVSGMAAAARGDMHIVEIEIDALHVEIGHPGVAHCRQNAAQIRVTGEESGFHQRRMRHGISHQARLVAAACAFDPYADELGGALSVAHDGLGELLRQHGERGLQGLRLWAVRAGDLRQIRLARRDDDEGIVGRGVAIDGDAVERLVRRGAGELLQHFGRDGAIGGDEAEHRRHIRANHARAFADTAQRHGDAVNRHLRAGRLGQGVGGHDGGSGIEPAFAARCGNRGGQAVDQALHGQRLQNHAGGKRQHLLGLHTKQARQFHAGLPRIGQTLSAGSGIGAAGVDDQGAHVLPARALQMLAAHLHRRGAKPVLGEHSRHAGAGCDLDDGDILAPRLADLRLGDTQQNALNGVQATWIRDLKIHRHDRLSTT